jgi:hypothetical protein
MPGVRASVATAIGWGVILSIPAGLLTTWAAVGFPVNGVLGFQQLDKEKMFFDSLRWSVPAAILLVVLFVVALKGRLTAKAVVALVVFATIGFPPTGFGAAVLLNVGLDWAPSTVRRAVVQSKQSFRSSFGQYRYVTVSGRGGANPEMLQVSRDLYES